MPHPAPNTSPPPIARWILERGLGEAHGSVIGDLEEEFLDDVDWYGGRRAALLFWMHVLWAIPSIRLHDLIWQQTMWRNYLTVAFRSLYKYKGFTSINVVSLAVSMSVCLLIITIARDQLSQDRFHENADRIYRVTSENTQPYSSINLATSPAPLGPSLLTEVPEVENMVRFRRLDGPATVADETVVLTGLYAEDSFFEVFDFALLRGNPTSALSEPYSIILSQAAATSLFGDDDVLGQVVDRGDMGLFTVTGILADRKEKTHLIVDVLASFSTLPLLGPETADMTYDWYNGASFYNYLLLAPDANPDHVRSQTQLILARHYAGREEPQPELQLQALSTIAAGNTLSNQIRPVMSRLTLNFLGAIGLALMLVAMFNYISITAARSLKRAREIGVRKVVGAHRSQIVQQFLSEAVVVALLACVLASVILAWMIPAFNNLTGLQQDLNLDGVSVDIWSDAGIYLLFLIFAVGVGLLAGIVPAFKLASYAPSRVLKGLPSIKGFGQMALRKSLIVLQFSLSIIGIIATTVIYQQFSFSLHADYGFDQHHLITIPLQDVAHETFRNELETLPEVAQVSMASAVPSAGSSGWTAIKAEHMERVMPVPFYATDSHFMDQFNVDLLAGRDFSSTDPTSGQYEGILLTEQAALAMGFESPESAVGHVVWMDASPDPVDAVIQGVVSNFYARGYDRGYVPVVLRQLPGHYTTAIVRLNTHDVAMALDKLQGVWKRVAPASPFTYAFYDDQLESQFAFMSDFFKFVGLLSGFVIFIACLGLLGMASFTAETRIQEVGIRKVLGADIRNVVLLLSGDYLKLITLAVLLASPLAYVGMQAFLQNFANRVDLSLWMFLAGIVPTIGIALLTLGSQTIKAGLTNPVETLRQD